jgi:hypothetical protein
MKIQPLRAKSPCHNDLLKEDQVPFTNINFESISDPLNHKIQGLALAKIPKKNFPIICGNHSLVAPQVLFNILPKRNFGKKKKQETLSKNMIIKPKKNLEDYHLENAKEKNSSIPIGISSNHYNSWVNALLQLVVFIPSFRAMFNYTPKSFSSFNDFIDVYLSDQEEKRDLTRASSIPVIETLARCINDKSFFQSEVVDLFGLLDALMRYVYPFESIFEEERSGGDLLALFPDWRISIENENMDLEEYLVKYLVGKYRKEPLLPNELLINFKWFLKKSKRIKEKCKASMVIKFFDELYLSTHYELDGFIEFRADDFNSASYLTYLKIEGIWYQCCDEKVRQVRPNDLHIALLRSFLYHYKKVKNSPAYESKNLV